MRHRLVPTEPWTSQFELVPVPDAQSALAALPGAGERVCWIGEPAPPHPGWSHNPPQLLLELEQLRCRKSPYEVGCLKAATRLGVAGHLAARKGLSGRRQRTGHPPGLPGGQSPVRGGPALRQHRRAERKRCHAALPAAIARCAGATPLAADRCRRHLPRLRQRHHPHLRGEIRPVRVADRRDASPAAGAVRARRSRRRLARTAPGRAPAGCTIAARCRRAARFRRGCGRDGDFIDVPATRARAPAGTAGA